MLISKGVREVGGTELSAVLEYSLPGPWLLPQEGGAVQQSFLLVPDQTIDAPVAWLVGLLFDFVL